MEKIKTGLAAFGMSGQIFHAPFISTNPAFCLTAITERNKNLSKERYPSARIVRSFEELVALAIGLGMIDQRKIIDVLIFIG